MTADRVLRDRVLERLDRDPSLTPASIGVTVIHGVATLFGVVGTLHERWAAEYAAEHVPGVRAVANDVVVSWKYPATRNAVMAEEVARALAWTPTLPLGAVKAAVSDGCVTLSGTVENELQRNDAAHATREVAGVKDVFNDLLIKYPDLSVPPLAVDREPVHLNVM